MLKLSKKRTMSQSRQWPRWALLLVLFVALLRTPCSAYRVGDAIDTTLRTSDETKNALRSQMPLFGVNSVAAFQEAPWSFSLSFEEGLRPLAWFDLKDSEGNPLEHVTVTFVYSRSGEGTIHAISSHAKYSPSSRDDVTSEFRVKYTWVEEEGLDLSGGSAVILLATILASLVFAFQAFGTVEQSEQTFEGGISDTASFASYGDQLGVGSGGASAPKWD